MMTPEQNEPSSKNELERVLGYQDDLVGFFTGSPLAEDAYKTMRGELLRDYPELAPSFLRRNRDNGALWSFAKSVSPQWEPRRVFIREQFEPLLSYLESGKPVQVPDMPGRYDASAWTGVQAPAQRATAIKTLIPVARSAIECLIEHLEKPGHNHGPPLDEVEDAIANLRALHKALGELLTVASESRFAESEGLILNVARYGRRVAKALKNDPVPYALSGTLLAILTACGVPGVGGYLATVALMMHRPLGD